MAALSRPADPPHDNPVTLRAASAVCLLLASLLAFADAGAAITIEFDRLMEIDAGRQGEARPVAVSIDPATEEACVTDVRGSALHVFDLHGNALFSTGPAARLSSPLDGCFTADGGFVFTDSDAGRGRTIRRLDFRGEPAAFRPESPDPEWTPDHIMATRDGDFVTLDRENNRLTRIDAVTGAVVWDRNLIADDEAGMEMGRPAEAPDGRIFVPGGELHSVLVCSPDGEVLKSFGTLGTAVGRMVFPVDVAFGPGGTVLVLDRMRHKIMVFDAALEFVTEFGRMGAGPGDFYHPLALAAAGDRIHVAQGFQGRVQTYRIFDTDEGKQ